jgi:hypothetical protein
MHARDLTAAAFAVATATLVVLLEPTALISCVLTYGIVFTVLWWLRPTVPASLIANCVTAAHCAVLVIYAIQYVEQPNYIGFSGGLGVGTDDHFFYTTGVIDLDGWFRARGNYLRSPYAYSDILRFVLSAYYQAFGHNHPLQVLLLNAAGLALCPLFAYVILQRLRMPPAVIRVGTLLCLFGPYLVANAAILIRDGWVAAFGIGAIAAFMEKRWILMLGLLYLCAVMRLESAMLSVGNLMLILAVYMNSARVDGEYQVRLHPARVAVMALLGVGALAVLALAADEIIAASTKIAVGRPEFVEEFIRQQAQTEGGTSTLYTIAQLPFPIRQVFGFLFFLGAPFLALDKIVSGTAFVPRALLANISSLLFAVLAPFFVKALFSRHLWSRSATAALMLVFLVNTAILAEFSMQIRHKTATLPLFYIIAAMGVAERSGSSMRLGVAAGMGVLGVNLLVAAINLL